MDDLPRKELLALLPDDKCRLELGDSAGMRRVADETVGEIAEAMSVSNAASDTLSVREKMRRRFEAGDIAPWRGALAAALLVERWDDGPRVEIMNYSPADSAFIRSALTASGNAKLSLAVLCRGNRAQALGIPDGSYGLILPATRGEFDSMLPGRLTWYDRERQQFADPCGFLCQRDRRLLMQALGRLEQTAPIASLLHDVEACEETAARVETDKKREECWLKCLKLVIGLLHEPCFEQLECRELPYRLRPECRFLESAGIGRENHPPVRPQLVYRWKGVPFAYGNDRVGVELLPGAEAAVEELWREYELLVGHSRRFVRALSERVNGFIAAQESCFAQRVQDKLIAWCAETLDAMVKAPEPLLMQWPWQEDSPALQALFTEYLPESLAGAALHPFAEKMTLMSGARLSDAGLEALFEARPDGESCAMVAPLSEGMITEIARHGWPGGMNAAAFMEQRQTDAGVEFVLHLTPDGQVCVSRLYAGETLVRTAPEDVPEIALWPAVPVDGGRWSAYWLNARGKVQARCMKDGAWVSLDGAGGLLFCGKPPQCVALYTEETCLGAVFSQAAGRCAPHLGEAVIALDAGSSGTSMAMLLGGQVQAVCVPAMINLLLRGQQSAEGQCLPATAFGPIVPMAVRLWGDGDDPKPFADGCVCADEALLDERVESDLLWRADERAQAARTLYFRQVALMCGFHAVMSGADTVSWRVTLPSAMAREGRARLMREISAACAWAEHTAGVLRAPGAEVLLQRESMAAGLYLRASGLMPGAFAMLNVGSSCASMALWLRGMNRPATEFHVHGGVASMLLPDMGENPSSIVKELNAASGGEAEHSDDQASSGMAAWSYHRSLTENALGVRLADTAAYMNACFRDGHPTRTQALLLMGFASLMTLTGNALEQVRRNPLLSDYLPAEMHLALCGRGSLVLAGMEPLLANAMIAFVRLPMGYDHPVRRIGMTLSGCAKMEAALGVGTGRVASAEATDQPMPEVMPLLHLAVRFLAQMRAAYPGHTEILFPGMFDEYGRFSAEAERHITRVAGDCARLGTEDGFLRCLDLLRTVFLAREPENITED